MLELTVDRDAEHILKECMRHGLIVKLDTWEKKHDARHVHLGYQGRPGVLEVTDLGGRSLLKVTRQRDGGWATALALELARPAKSPRKRR